MREVSIAEAIASQRPEWITLILSRRGDGRVNIMPAGWVMRVSGDPPMFAVAVHHRQYTNELIREAGEFVLAFPSASMGEMVWFCGTHSGRDTDKVARCGAQLLPAKELVTPLLNGAFVNLECRLHSMPEAGDHTVFIGEVVAAHMSGAQGPLVNFGAQGYALAKPVEETIYKPGA